MRQAQLDPTKEVLLFISSRGIFVGKAILRSMMFLVAVVVVVLPLRADNALASGVAPVDEVYTCPKALAGDSNAIAFNIDHYLTQKDLLTAAEIASDCAVFGSTLDDALISPVLGAFAVQFEKFVKDGWMSQAQKEEMLEKVDECRKRYDRKEHGSIGKSESVHCQLRVFVAYDSLFGPIDI